MARVLMIAFTHYAWDNRVRREAEALADRGDEVEVISLKQVGDEFVQRFNGVKVFQVPIRQYHGSSTFMYLGHYALFMCIAALMSLLFHLRRPYHVVQVHTLPDFIVVTAVIPKLLGAGLVIDVHDLVPELYQSKFGISRSHLIYRLNVLIERLSIGFADRAIAVHRPHLEALMEHGNPKEKFITLLNLPDPRVFSVTCRVQADKGPGLRLIYHGTVSKRHGLETAVRAMHELRHEIEGLELRIVGDGDVIHNLIELANELNLAESVRVRKGFVRMEELIPTILGADIGIVPILLDDFTKYMLPAKLLEYVTLGLPVICSRTQTIEAYFDDSMVQYFRPGDVEDLANQIRHLHQSPERRQSMVANAGRFNEEYSWARQKLEYYRLIDSVI